MLDFISYNRFEAFVNKLVTVSNTVTSVSYVDNSPDGLFTSPRGTILQKRGDVISYKYPGEHTFTVINYANASISNLLSKYSNILNSGVNKNSTWIKIDDENGKNWKNRGNNTSNIDICAIVRCGDEINPTPTATPTPTPTPYVTCFCDVFTADSVTAISGSFDHLEVKTLIISGSGICEPTSSTPGTYGQIVICQNYVYIHDGIQWKRIELTVYF